MRRNDVGVLDSETHRDNRWEELVPYIVCGHWVRGEGDLLGVLTPCPDLIGLAGGGVTVEGPHIGQAMESLHVQALEGPGGYHVGGSVTIDMVPKL